MIRGAGRNLAWMALAVVLGVAPLARASQPAAEPAAPPAHASGAPIFIPDVSQFLPPATNRESLSTSLQLLILFSILTILPSIILMMTCFSRMIIVLVLLRQALGTASLPPSQVLIGLAFFLTLLVMAPTWERIHAQAVEPYLNGDLSQTAALGAATGELRGFMFDQIEAARNEQDVYMLVEYARREAIPETQVLTREEVPLTALIPAFILSELKVAFVLGFRIYLPFLVIDMVISTILVSMGMLMLPPALISLPFKLLLFVLADGWHLVAGSLTASVVT